MSEVFSFRLNDNNPRERLALGILQIRNSQGFSTRQTIVESLILLGDSKDQYKSINEMTALINTIEKLSKLVSKSSLTQPNEDYSRAEQFSELQSSFVTSIKSAIKPGVHI